MYAKALTLEKHFRGQHPGEAASFLSKSEKPRACIYNNWEEFLADPNTRLEQHEGAKKIGPGRPAAAWGAGDSLERAHAPDESDSDSWSPKREDGNAAGPEFNR